MKTLVPTGFITVVETSEKSKGVGPRSPLWDAVWKPKINEFESDFDLARLRIRSVSKLSKDDAVLRLKFKVCKHFGGQGWESRTIPPTGEPNVYLGNKPWGPNEPETSALGKRPKLNKPEPSIPEGIFKTTKHRVTKYSGSERKVVSEWRTIWTQGPDPITGYLARYPLSFDAISQSSAKHSLTRCEAKVRSHFMPKEYKKAQVTKSKVKKLQLLIDINNHTVTIPRGQVRLVFSKSKDSIPQLRSYRWYPIDEEARNLLKLATKDPTCDYLESTAVYGQATRDFDQFRRKVLKTFSGKFQKKDLV